MTVWVGSSVKRKKCLKLRFFVLVYYKERKNQISEEKKYYNTEMIKKTFMYTSRIMDKL